METKCCDYCELKGLVEGQFYCRDAACMCHPTYKALCIEPDCYTVVEELDVVRGTDRHIYERSKKCGVCRTPADDKAIKRFRKKNRNPQTT